MNAKRLNLSLLAVGLIAALIAVYIQRDYRQLRHNLEKLATLGSKSTSESAIDQASKALKISELFSTNVMLHVGLQAPSSRSRSEMQTMIHAVRSYADSIHVKIPGQTIDIQNHHRLANMTITMEVTVAWGGRVETDTAEYQLRWVKASGAWCIESVETSEAGREATLWDQWLP